MYRDPATSLGNAWFSGTGHSLNGGSGAVDQRAHSRVADPVKAPFVPFATTRLFPKLRIWAPPAADIPSVLPKIAELFTSTIAPFTAWIPVGPPLTLTLSRRRFASGFVVGVGRSSARTFA